MVYHRVSFATQLHQEQIHGMYWYTRKKEEKEKEHEEGKERKIHRKRRKRKARKRIKQALTEQAESLGDKVVVRWYFSCFA